jgi:hypothetical protein
MESAMNNEPFKAYFTDPSAPNCLYDAGERSALEAAYRAAQARMKAHGFELVYESEMLVVRRRGDLWQFYIHEDLL